MLLGALVERVSKLRLDVFTAAHVFGPLGLTATGYGVPDGVAVAATEDCGWRGRVLQGEVHDENAFVFDGVAGHAGLFGTAFDVARYAQAWLRLEAPFASPELLLEATREHAQSVTNETVGGRRGWGWQLAGEGSSAGRHAGPERLRSHRFYGDEFVARARKKPLRRLAYEPRSSVPNLRQKHSRAARRLSRRGVRLAVRILVLMGLPVCSAVFRSGARGRAAPHALV